MENVLLPALDYKQQTTLQNIIQCHGQMKSSHNAEEVMKAMKS